MSNVYTRWHLGMRIRVAWHAVAEEAGRGCFVCCAEGVRCEVYVTRVLHESRIWRMYMPLE